MTTMLNVGNLIKLGLNQNEAKVYLSLIKFGKADAHELIKDTKFHKNIVYDNLDKLINKGLVSYIVEGKKRVFVVSSPEMLIELVDKDLEELKEKKGAAFKIVQEIKNRIKLVPHRQESYIFRGQMGIRAYHNEIIKESRPYSIFGAPKQSVEIMGEHFWENFEAKRAEKKIKVRMIFNSSLKEFGDKLKNKHTKIRYFNKDFEALTQTDVHEKKVAIIVWTEEPILFLIEDKEVANSYRKYFEKMWREAK